MKRTPYLLLGLLAGFLLLAVPAHAQDVFSSGDSDSGGGGDPGPGPETFSGGGGGADEDFGGHDPGKCTGINEVFNMGRCNPRQLPGYTGCGPYYNNYNYWIQTMLKHWGNMCTVVNGNQLWCRQMKAGMCNPDAGGRPDRPLVDSGMRLTPNCEMHCDFSVGPSNNQPPPPRPAITHLSPVPMPTPVPAPPAPDPLDMPCTMPPLDQLAGDPEPGSVAVAAFPPPVGGDVAPSYMLPPDDGAVAVALALPTTLQGGVTKSGSFTVDKPLTLKGKATINGWRAATPQQIKLSGFAIKSLRIPPVYKPATPSPAPNISPQEQTQIQLVLHGDAGTYDPEVGKQRFIQGLQDGWNDELKQLSRFGEVDEAEKEEKADQAKEKNGQKCEIKLAPSPLFGDVKPAENPGETGKMITDMIEAIAKNHNNQKQFPNATQAMEKGNPIAKIVTGGFDFIKNFSDAYKKIMDRDTRIRNAMDNSPGHDLDPKDVGYLAGQDLADAFQFWIKGSVSLP